MKHLISLFLFCMANAAMGSALVIPMFLVNGQKPPAIGTITAEQSPEGLLLTPNLTGLTPGEHGFHLHQNPSCADHAMGAGPHFDPSHTGKHLGPYDDGHDGDLPVLVVDKNGKATTPSLVPRLTITELQGHALVIHAGGDNYSDEPQPLGGGGARVACGFAPN